jgi:hypothetical protein
MLELNVGNHLVENYSSEICGLSFLTIRALWCGIKKLLIEIKHSFIS